MDIAVWIHDIIIDGLDSGLLKDCREGPSATIAQILQHDDDGDLTAVAEECFELIYGCDPYTFLKRLDTHARDSIHQRTCRN